MSACVRIAWSFVGLRHTSWILLYVPVFRCQEAICFALPMVPLACSVPASEHNGLRGRLVDIKAGKFWEKRSYLVTSDTAGSKRWPHTGYGLRERWLWAVPRLIDFEPGNNTASAARKSLLNLCRFENNGSAWLSAWWLNATLLHHSSPTRIVATTNS